MKKTGIFYHEIFDKEGYKALYVTVAAGFEAIKNENFLKLPNIALYKPKPASEELILKVHTKRWVEEVKNTGYYNVSLYTVGAAVEALEKILVGEIDNALVFGGVGGHHAHADYAWGGCFFNPTAVALKFAREKFKLGKVMIVDTDTHHADGTRDLLLNDDKTLHICYCGYGKTVNETKICFNQASSDEDFLEKLSTDLPPLIVKFKPEIILWKCGMDTHKDSYGTRRLTEKCYPKMAKIIKRFADENCNGKIIVGVACNAPAYVSSYTCPRILDCLAETGKYVED